MKKRCLFSVACVLLLLFGHAQNVAINTDASQPNKNAILDVKSGNKGILIPRMTTEARNRIPNTQGLLVYDISTDNFWFNTGRGWRCIPREDDDRGGDAWLLRGNNNTNDKTSFLGTTNNVPLNIRVNNQQSGRIDPKAETAFWGYKAGAMDAHKDTATFNTGVGAYALQANTDGSWNTAMGNRTLYSNTQGFGNTGLGYNALYSNTEGRLNTGVGLSSLSSNTTGGGNTAVGVLSLGSNSTGGANTAVGDQAMWLNTTGSENAAVGMFALNTNSEGTGNTAMGWNAMWANTTGSYNVAKGWECLMNNTTGNENTANGVQSVYMNVTGSDNTGTGFHSLWSNRSGSGNTGIGAQSLSNNVSGSNITTLGASANVAMDGLTNATAVGYGAIVNSSDKVRIGNSAVTVIEGQVPFTTPSDGRFKFNIQEDVKGLDFILRLRPVTYQFDVLRFEQVMSKGIVHTAAYDEASRIRRTGFIAQEVDQAAQATGYDFSGIIRPKTAQDHYSLSYDAFVVPLVKAVQQQQEIIQTQGKKLAEQEERMNAQDKKIAQLEQTLEALKQNLSK